MRMELDDLNMEFGRKWFVEMKRGLRIDGWSSWTPVSGCHGPSRALAEQFEISHKADQHADDESS